MSSIFHGQGIEICEGLVRGGSEAHIPHTTPPSELCVIYDVIKKVINMNQMFFC
jgi:hypothetical protein